MESSQTIAQQLDGQSHCETKFADLERQPYTTAHKFKELRSEPVLCSVGRRHGYQVALFRRLAFFAADKIKQNCSCELACWQIVVSKGLPKIRFLSKAVSDWCWWSLLVFRPCRSNLLRQNIHHDRPAHFVSQSHSWRRLSVSALNNAEQKQFCNLESKTASDSAVSDFRSAFVNQSVCGNTHQNYIAKHNFWVWDSQARWQCHGLTKETSTKHQNSLLDSELRSD